MRERDRLTRREFERQDREEREKPIREAKAELEKTQRDLIAVQREFVTRVPDPNGVYLSPEMDGARMDSLEQANAFNREQARIFKEKHPEFYPSLYNAQIISDYFICNGIAIVDADTIEHAYERLKGVLEVAPTDPTAPTAPIQDNFDSLPRLPLNHAQPSGWKRQSDGSQEGYDLNTGLKRIYTSYEIDRMDSETYRKVFCVPTPALTKANFIR